MKPKNWKVRVGLIGLLSMVLLSLARLERPAALAQSEAGTIGTQDAQLSVSVGQDGSNRLYVILENSQIRVRYGYFFEGSAQTAIQELTTKSTGVNQAGLYLDAMSFRGLLREATITYNGTDRKTVRMVWPSTHPSGRNDVVTDVSIFPNSPYIAISPQYYLDNIVEQGAPGGATTGTYRFYGAESWVRGYVGYPASYYNRFPNDGINDPADGGSLNYNNYMIGGIYNPSNGQGFGRVMPMCINEIVKLLFNKGFEWYPNFYKIPEPYTSYLFVVTGGANEIISRGQQIADSASGPNLTLQVNTNGPGTVTRSAPKSCYNSGETVTLTATGQPGYVFSNWTGDLSSTANPVQITMTGNRTVTANFVPGSGPTATPPTTYSLTVNVSGNGTVSRNPNQASYPAGTVVTLTANPNSGHVFSGWSGGLTGTANPAQVTMTGNRTITATFVPLPTLTERVYFPFIGR